MAVVANFGLLKKQKCLKYPMEEEKKYPTGEEEKGTCESRDIL